jgi:hypothetical protein
VTKSRPQRYAPDFSGHMLPCEDGRWVEWAALDRSEDAELDLTNAHYSSSRTHGAHFHDGDESCREYVVGQCVVDSALARTSTREQRIVVDAWERGHKSGIADEHARAVDACAAMVLAERHKAQELRASLSLLGSEFGRLLAERDRLISSGADPGDLLVPDAPPG